MCLASWPWWWIQGWHYDSNWSSQEFSGLWWKPWATGLFSVSPRRPVAMREATLQTQLLELQRSETSILKTWWLWSQETTPEICPQPGLPCAWGDAFSLVHLRATLTLFFFHNWGVYSLHRCIESSTFFSVNLFQREPLLKIKSVIPIGVTDFDWRLICLLLFWEYLLPAL